MVHHSRWGEPLFFISKLLLIHTNSQWQETAQKHPEPCRKWRSEPEAGYMLPPPTGLPLAPQHKHEDHCGLASARAPSRGCFTESRGRAFLHLCSLSTAHPSMIASASPDTMGRPGTPLCTSQLSRTWVWLGQLLPTTTFNNQTPPAIPLGKALSLLLETQLP